MDSENLSFRKINEQNSQFWRTQSEVTLGLLLDKEIYEAALSDMNSEIDRGIPVRSRKSLEDTLAGVVKKRSTFRAGFSRKGGKSLKGDALQALIEEILKRRPTITLGQLSYQLAGSAGAGTVTSIDRESEVLADEGRQIHFVNNDGRPKTATVSGLKFRLVRAKRKIREQ